MQTSDVETLRLVLPFPPSVNNLYTNQMGRGRSRSPHYNKWVQSATSELWGQKLIRFTVPVVIIIQIEDIGKCDIDNLAKPVLDFLVHHHVIPDDGRGIVRKLTLEWANVKGCVVEISPAPIDRAVDVSNFTLSAARDP